MSEFSLPSLMSKLQVLKNLSASTNPQQRSIYGKMLKNACVLQVVGKKAPYRTLTPSKLFTATAL
jgi:hypothetical protein